jgi:hypothetical protein
MAAATFSIMASRTTVVLEDDLDGGDASETVAFGLDGQDYEIDLNDENAARLRGALADFVTSARATGRRSSGRQRRGRSQGRFDPKAVRAWANEQGMEVNARGRIASSIVEQFHAATSKVADVATDLEDAVTSHDSDGKGKGKKRRRRR